jgi:integrase
VEALGGRFLPANLDLQRPRFDHARRVEEPSISDISTGVAGKLGPAGVLSVEQARRAGRSALAEALLGSDPQARRQELRSIPTLNELIRDRYLPHAQASKRSWATDETLLRIHILPALGRLTLDQIAGEHIVGLINDMRAKGYAGGTTNRVLVLLRYVFNLARKWNVPGASTNPTAGLSAVPEVHRQRFLTPEEAQRLVGSIQADENQIAAKAIMLLLLTGARRREVTRARWEEVDWEKRTLLVPVSKSGKPRAIALSAAAIALLRTAASDSVSPYVFGVDPVWWTPLKLIFEVSDAPLPNRLSAGVSATDGQSGAIRTHSRRAGA